MKFYTKAIKQLSQSYTEFVTTSAKGAYPIIDRIVSYGLPTAGAVLWSVYGKHENDYQHSTGYALPAGLAFYGISQIGLTYAKPYVEVKEDDGIFSKGLKKFASIGVEVVDILNNIVPYTIACNMLPNTYGLNEVAAWRILPSIIQGVESDIKAAVNKTEYTKTFAGDIYSTTIAGFASVNLRNILSKQLFPSGQESAQITKETRQSSAGDQDTDKKIITPFIEAFSYPLIKKLLIKTSYEKNQIMQDLAKGFMKDQITGLSKIEGIKSNIDNYCGIEEQSIFKCISKFAIIDLALKAIAVASENIAEFEIHCDEYPELCPVDDVIIRNTEF